MAHYVVFSERLGCNPVEVIVGSPEEADALIAQLTDEGYDSGAWLYDEQEETM